MIPLRRAAAALGIDYRQAAADDLPFLLELYAEGRIAQLESTGWPEAAKRAFLAQQHHARRAQYRARFPNAENQIIRRQGQDVGQLLVAETPGAIRLVDIALLPEARSNGIGAAILADLILAARTSGRGVELSVESSGRARRLYERLGFRVVGESPPYVAMRWSPEPVGAQ